LVLVHTAGNPLDHHPARVAELADALASGASVRKNVGVQVPPRAQSAVLELQAPEVTNSKGVVTSGFSCFPGGVVPDCAGGDLWGRVLVSWARFIEGLR